MKTFIIPGSIVCILIALRITRWRFTSNVERPEATSIKKYEKFEVRTLPPQITATVSVTAPSESQAAGRGFQALAGFIFGDNTRRGNIAMTAPVTSTQISEKIAMTAPVVSQWNGNWTYEIGFIMPSQRTLETLPVPNNDAITITEQSPYEVAVWRFWGYARPDEVTKQKDLFVQALEDAGVMTQGNITLAQYNDPWTPPRMRTNEIWISIK